jgi:hypothetical protein
MPLPKSTMSALLANSSGCCAWIVTPFIEVMLGRGAADLRLPALRRQAIEQAKGDEGVELVEAVEGDDGDPHGPPS